MCTNYLPPAPALFAFTTVGPDPEDFQTRLQAILADIRHRSRPLPVGPSLDLTFQIQSPIDPLGLPTGSLVTGQIWTNPAALVSYVSDLHQAAARLNTHVHPIGGQLLQALSVSEESQLTSEDKIFGNTTFWLSREHDPATIYADNLAHSLPAPADDLLSRLVFHLPLGDAMALLLVETSADQPLWLDAPTTAPPGLEALGNPHAAAAGRAHQFQLIKGGVHYYIRPH